MRARRFYNRVVPDPHVFADVNASPPVEKHTRTCRPWDNSSEYLQDPIF
jgi:hypothetical protein